MALTIYIALLEYGGCDLGTLFDTRESNRDRPQTVKNAWTGASKSRGVHLQCDTTPFRHHIFLSMLGLVLSSGRYPNLPSNSVSLVVELTFLVSVCYWRVIVMAQKVPSVSDVLEIVEEKLKCFVCLENFTQPKSLPCLHVFCNDCLGGLPHLRHGEGYSYVVKCPICWRPAQVPEVSSVSALSMRSASMHMKRWRRFSWAMSLWASVTCL